jgi:2-alkyl-3-oxoalkanoate reductase
MKVFVTGGSGFLGKRLLKLLQERGHTVHALARSAASAAQVSALGATPVLGDLASCDSLNLQGFDAIIHAAAPVVFWAPWQLYQQQTVDATRSLALAAQRAGVPRFIYVSSESVMQSSGSLLDIDENYPANNTPCGDYGRSKWLAEQALAELPASAMQTVILRPTFIWGNGSDAVQTMVAKVKSGQFAWIDHGQTSFEHVHVDNVAHACELALHKGQGTYLLTNGEPVPTQALLKPLIETHGVTVGSKSVPSWLARPLAQAVEGAWRLIGAMNSAPPLTRFDVAFMSQPRRYNITKIQRELGYSPMVSMAQGLTQYKATPA